MFLLIELTIVLVLLTAGCWSRRVAIVFLPVVVVLLMLFALRFGNPIGLVASGGGWIILDTMMVIAVVVANIVKARA